MQATGSQFTSEYGSGASHAQARTSGFDGAVPTAVPEEISVDAEPPDLLRRRVDWRGGGYDGYFPRCFYSTPPKFNLVLGGLQRIGQNPLVGVRMVRNAKNPPADQHRAGVLPGSFTDRARERLAAAIFVQPDIRTKFPRMSDQRTASADRFGRLPVTPISRRRLLRFRHFPDLKLSVPVASGGGNKETEPGSCFRFWKRRGCVSGGNACWTGL